MEAKTFISFTEILFTWKVLMSFVLWVNLLVAPIRMLWPELFPEPSLFLWIIEILYLLNMIVKALSKKPGSTA